MTYLRKLLGYLKLISHGITGAMAPTRKKNRSAVDKNVNKRPISGVIILITYG